MNYKGYKGQDGKKIGEIFGVSPDLIKGVLVIYSAYGYLILVYNWGDI